jgi:hypothetical protein
MRLSTKTANLRIATHHSDNVDTWVLQGTLCGLMVDELAATWHNTRAERAGRECAIDIVDLTGIDERGEEQLIQMMKEGARFVVRGVYSRSLLDSLSERCRQEA